MRASDLAAAGTPDQASGGDRSLPSQVSAVKRESRLVIGKSKRNAEAARSSATSFHRWIGYGGHCPPGGTHHYYFTLYALDLELKLEPSATKGQLLKAMQGHILAEGQLMGRYKR